MQSNAMTVRKPKASKSGAAPKPPVDKAFDTWLQRGLHDIFDDVAREPIPDDLLKLIREDREK